MRLVALDFETKRIEKRPMYPPEPVGLAVQEDGEPPQYYAWGHPTENNCTMKKVAQRLKGYFKNYKCVFHNSEFDIAVATKFFYVPYPREWEDTMFLAYLYDPRDTIALKPLAEKHLNMPADEQQKLRQWILDNTACRDTKEDPWGAWISKAPGNLCSSYAKGDVVRTLKLFSFFSPKIQAEGMGDAYIREKKCRPIFEGMSTSGLRGDEKKLRKDSAWLAKEIKTVEQQIVKVLGCKGLDINKPRQLAQALEDAQKITKWVYTEPTATFPDGQKSTKRDNLVEGCNDPSLIGLLTRHGVMKTYLSTFVNPWLESVEVFGKIFPTFHQTRSANENGSSRGTRTGRPSSSAPNLLNVPRNLKTGNKYLADLPNIREYILPDEGCVINDRDYSQQEVRILAHFSEGSLFRVYENDPTTDIHDYSTNELREMLNVEVMRNDTKGINFGIIYGMGATALAKKIGRSEEEAARFKEAYFRAFPDIQDLMRDLKKLARNDEQFRTWGGRLYFCEQPILHTKGPKQWLQTFEYKMINYLIQGSAADITKEAMIRVHDVCKNSRIMLQVYDQIPMSVDKGCAVREMKLQKEAMESVELSVPLLTTGKTSSKNWGCVK